MAERRSAVTEGLDVAHLRLVIGIDGRHARLMWVERYPDLMDGGCRSPAAG
jgi:hypothetical protein